MGGAIRLRTDSTDDDLRSLAKQHRQAACTRRLLALSIIYDVGRRSDAARFGGLGLQVLRDWVLRFNSKGPAGLEASKARGRKALLNEEQREALASFVDRGPQFELDGVVRWRLCDLVRWIEKEFNIIASRQTVGRELHIMGCRNLSARPRHHAQNIDAIDAVKKTSQPLWQKSANVSQKGKR